MNSTVLLWGALILVVLVAGFILVAYLRWRSRQLEEQEEQAPALLLEDLEYSGAQPKQYELSRRPTVLGRAEGEDPAFDYVVVESKTVSRKHAVIDFRDYQAWVFDQGSANGTFINDRRIDGRAMLKHGDVLRLYKYRLKVLIPSVSGQDEERTLLAGAEQEDPEATLLISDSAAVVEELPPPPPAAPPPAPPAPEKAAPAERGAPRQKLSIDHFIDDDMIND